MEYAEATTRHCAGRWSPRTGLRSSTRSAAAPTKFSETSSPWRDWACREHLVTFGLPKMIKTSQEDPASDRPRYRVPRQVAGARRPAHRRFRKANGGTGSGEPADDPPLG